jgi:hypothetical protein
MTRLNARRPKSVAAGHAEWLSLVEPVGAFLTVPVLKRVFANGLDRTDNETRAEVRLRLDELGRTETERTAWLRWVLGELLGLADELREGPAVPAGLVHTVSEHSTTLRPDLVLSDADGMSTRMLVCRWPLGTQLDQTPRTDQDGRPSRWSASPIERAATLCRSVGVPVALVTDTDRFALVWAPKGGAGGHGVFVSSLFAEERELLDAFVSLLGSHRWFAVATPDSLEGLFAESADSQAEVTNQLGKQVREAVELLIAAFSRSHRNSGLKLLAEVSPEEVYSAAVTVMMRLVVLLSAEERRLLPIDDELYVSSYAVSSLRDQLDDERITDGEDALERRSTAWFRLLAAFRAVHGGLRHDRLTLPAYGSALFDPDRYPFLEGRSEVGGLPGDGNPLPVDDLTVLAILDSLQVLTFRDGGVTEARRLSYRGLDVEQIGHVYEGLLDHSCTITSDLAVGLVGRRGDEAELGVFQLEEWAAAGRSKLLAELESLTGKRSKALALLLDAPLSHEDMDRLRSACDNDDAALARVLPFAGIIRPDLRGLPTVFMPNALYVTQTSLRRDSGTEYTTKELADEVVRYALEPLVYSSGPVDGAEPWVLKSSDEILSLKVCDPAVGSGAIIVAACRYLADRLVEAWKHESDAGQLPARLAGLEADDWTLEARRLVADHCLYGVDRNPMAVEMAKLSLWLTTMAKERPFTFLDHSFRAGDSLLGVTSLDQIAAFHLDPAEGRRLHSGRLWDADVIPPIISRARELTAELESIDVRDPRDASEKARLHGEIISTFEVLNVIADLVVGGALSTTGQKAAAYIARLETVRDEVRKALDRSAGPAERGERLNDLRLRAEYWLDSGRPSLNPDRRPLHWPLAFPEVARNGGFDAIVGNPPFLGGQRISAAMGTPFRDYLVRWIADGRKGSADLVAYFFLRASSLASARGEIGLLATNTISQGDTREVALDHLLSSGWSIRRAVRSRPWPGTASLEVSQVWLGRGQVTAAHLDGKRVSAVTAALTRAGRGIGNPYRLAANLNQCFQGSNILGQGFTMSPSDAARLIDSDVRNADVLFPLLNGDDLSSSPTMEASRWVINFFDWSEERARSYPDCFDVVERLVKPERAQNNDRRRREIWWRFTRPTVDLYSSIARQSRVMAVALTSKAVRVAAVPSRQVFSHALGVFVYEDFAHLALLNSELHLSWVLRYASTLETRVRYTPSDVFETFPQPVDMDPLMDIGERLDDLRCSTMRRLEVGLTKLYNRVNGDDRNPAICAMRELQIELDVAAASAYGWVDLDLGHDFHQTEQGARFTISPNARAEILDRMLELNHARHAAELADGLHRGRKSDGRHAAIGGLFS